MNRTLRIASILLLSSLFAFQVSAQGVPVAGDDINLSTSSDSPYPGDIVTITARSFTMSINSASITWTVDGKVTEKGTGLTTLDIIAPPLGKTSIVKLTAIGIDKKTYTASIAITSGSVDMILENDGYTHSLFLGKTPTVYQNTVKIIAMPHVADSKGVEYDPKSLVYKWKKNSRVVEDQSGFGKQTFTAVGDIVPRAFTITVEVSTRDGKAKASGTINISYISPSLSFYIDDPLYGPLFNSAIKDYLYIGKEKETSVLALPFGFNKPHSGIGNLSLNWFVNGVSQTDLNSNESITLRAPETEGNSTIELNIKNKKEILQGASAGFGVKFNSKQSTSN